MSDRSEGEEQVESIRRGERLIRIHRVIKKNNVLPDEVVYMLTGSELPAGQRGVLLHRFHQIALRWHVSAAEQAEGISIGVTVIGMARLAEAITNEHLVDPPIGFWGQSLDFNIPDYDPRYDIETPEDVYWSPIQIGALGPCEY